MKAKALVLVVLFLAMRAPAPIVASFKGWDWLKATSSDVIVARCVRTPSESYRDGVQAEMAIVCVLKGTNGATPGVVRSFYWPRQGEHYLIFADYHDGSYQALEEYRFVPLGVQFLTNSVVGKPFDDQIQLLFKNRLDQLNRELEQGQEEKKRLEEGLKR